MTNIGPGLQVTSSSRYEWAIEAGLYNQAYRSILRIIVMSNDGGMCFVVVPDKKYYGLLLKI